MGMISIGFYRKPPSKTPYRSRSSEMPITIDNKNIIYQNHEVGQTMDHPGDHNLTESEKNNIYKAQADPDKCNLLGKDSLFA
jgi:hypothetical protein